MFGSLLLCRNESLCVVYMHERLNILRTRQRKNETFLSVVRVRALFDMISVHVVFSFQHPSECMHMRLGLLLALLLSVFCSTLPLSLSRSIVVSSIQASSIHIYCIIVTQPHPLRSDAQTLTHRNYQQFSLFRSVFVWRKSSTFFRHFFQAHSVCLFVGGGVCAPFFFWKAHALIVFTLFTSFCVACVFTSEHWSEMKCLYILSWWQWCYIIVVGPSTFSLSFIVARTFAIPTRSTLFQLCSMPARILNVIETRFETFKWIWIVRYFTFLNLFLHIHIAQCDCFPSLAHFIWWLIISTRKFSCHSTLLDFWLDFLVLPVFLFCFIDWYHMWYDDG